MHVVSLKCFSGSLIFGMFSTSATIVRSPDIVILVGILETQQTVLYYHWECEACSFSRPDWSVYDRERGRMTVRAGALNTSPLSSHHEFQSVDVVKLGKEIFKTNDVKAKNRNKSFQQEEYRFTKEAVFAALKISVHWCGNLQVRVLEICHCASVLI